MSRGSTQRGPQLRDETRRVGARFWDAICWFGNGDAANVSNWFARMDVHLAWWRRILCKPALAMPFFLSERTAGERLFARLMGLGKVTGLFPSSAGRCRTRSHRGAIRRLLHEPLEERRVFAISTWDGGGLDSNWSTAANWIGDIGPSPNDDLVFPSVAARFTNTNDLVPGTGFGSLTISGSNYNLSGNRIDLANGITSQGVSNTIGLNLRLISSQAISHSTASTLSVNGAIDLNGQNLSVNTANNLGITSFGGVITGSGGLTAMGGKTILNGSSSSNSNIYVNHFSTYFELNGTWNVTASDVEVFGDSTLGGVGNLVTGVAFSTQLFENATLNPGSASATGIFNINNVDFRSGSTLDILLNGTTPGTGYDQLNVAGNIDLNNTHLRLSGSYIPAGGESFRIINNDGAEAVNGTFVGLPEGAILSNFLGSGLNASITYRGGVNGNDVVLSVVSVNVAVVPNSVNEDGLSNFDYTFTRTGDTASPLVVAFGVAGTATFGSDYMTSGATSFGPTSGTITIPAGSSTAVLSIDPTLDSTVELNETVVLQIASSSSYNLGSSSSATGSIANDDAATISIDNVTLNEGDSGNTGFTFNLTLSHPVDAAVSLQADTSNGSAVASSDFIPLVALPVHFAPNDTSVQQVTVQVHGDTTVELNEAFQVLLSNLAANGRNVTLVPGNGLAIVSADDIATVSIDSVSLAEGNAGQTAFTFNITLSQPVDVAVHLSASTSDATAISPSDYTPVVATPVTFAANSTTAQQFTVQVSGDTTVELNEAFQVLLSGLSAGSRNVSISVGTGVGTVVNNDSATIAIDSVTLAEGNAGKTGFNFHISLSQPVDVVVGLQANTVDGTALAGNDFTAVIAAPISFNANSTTSQQVSVQVNADSTVELNEVFQLLLSNLNANGRNISIGTSVGIGAINNDDSAIISIGSATKSEGNAGQSAFTFHVSLSHPVDIGISLQADTANGTAIATSDYAAIVAYPILFSPNSTTVQEVSVQVHGDLTVELNEVFQVLISNLLASGRSVTLGTIAGSGTINNDDSAMLSVGNVSQSEGDAGQKDFTFDITLSQPVDTALNVQVSTVDGTAIASDDYSAVVALPIVFVANSTAKQQVIVQVLGDTTVELDEAFQVLLSSLNAGGRNVSISPNAGVGAIVNNDAALIDISSVALTEGNSGQKSFAFSITLTRPVDVAIQLQANTSDVAAASPTDYTAISLSPINFSAGSTMAQQIIVQVNGDNNSESNEVFQVILSSLYAAGRNVSIGTGIGTGSILNDDDATISISNVTKSEGSGNGVTNFVFDISLSNPLGVPVALQADTQDGTAHAPSDYHAVIAAPILFPANSTATQQVSVAVMADNVLESMESLRLVLSQIVTAGPSVTFATGFGTATIVNDDDPPQYPPVLDPVPNQIVSSGNRDSIVILSAMDPNNDPLTYTASAQSIEYYWDRTLGLGRVAGNEFLNWGGLNEKWLSGSPHPWYYITPDGSLYRWLGNASLAADPLIDKLSPSSYRDTSLLHNAAANYAQASLSVLGNLLTINPADTFSGKIVVTASVSDGHNGSDSEVFFVTVLEPGYDHVAPTVTNRSPANAATVLTSSLNLDVVFSEIVVGVDVSDLVLSGTGTANAIKSPPILIGGNRWRFPVSGLTSGYVEVALAPDFNDIEDLAGNDLMVSAWGFATDIVLSDTAPPTVLDISPAQGATVTSSSMNLDLTFSEAVTGVDVSDLVLSGDGAATSIKNSPVYLGGNTWRFPVVGLSSGTINVAFSPDSDDVEDLAGNDLAPFHWSFLAIVAAKDTSPPTVINRVPVNGSTVIASTVNLDITFSETVTNVDIEDVSLTGPGAVHAIRGAPTNIDGNTWRFPVSGLVNGNVLVSLASSANSIEDLVGNDLAAMQWSFQVAIEAANQPPRLASIFDRTLSSATQNATVILSATDPNADSLTFGATAQSLEYFLAQSLGLRFSGVENEYWNYLGRNEKWLTGTVAPWYYITPDGKLYRWLNNGNAASDPLIEQASIDAYRDTRLLYDAPHNNAPASVSVSGNVLTINPNDSFVGKFQVTAMVRDGRGGMDSKSFLVNVLAATLDTTPPTVINRTPAQSAIVSKTNINIDITFSEPVTNMNAGDLLLTGIGAINAIQAAPVNVGNNTWSFPVSGLVDGIVNVSLASGANEIEDIEGNDLAPVTWSFTVSLAPPNLPPTLTPIGDRTMPTSQDTLQVALSATDPNNDTLVYSASAQSIQHYLDQSLGLARAGSNEYFNFGGRQEKWMSGTAGSWYYITPDGKFYRWLGGELRADPMLEQLSTADYANTARLYDAAPNDAPAEVSISGNWLTINPNSAFVGVFYIRITVSDGNGGTATETIRIAVTG